MKKLVTGGGGVLDCGLMKSVVLHSVRFVLSAAVFHSIDRVKLMSLVLS